MSEREERERERGEGETESERERRVREEMERERERERERESERERERWGRGSRGYRLWADRRSVRWRDRPLTNKCHPTPPYTHTHMTHTHA